MSSSVGQGPAPALSGVRLVPGKFMELHNIDPVEPACEDPDHPEI